MIWMLRPDAGAQISTGNHLALVHNELRDCLAVSVLRQPTSKRQTCVRNQQAYRNFWIRGGSLRKQVQVTDLECCIAGLSTCRYAVTSRQATLYIRYFLS